MAIITAVSASSAIRHCENDVKDVETIVTSLRDSKTDLGSRLAAASEALIGRPFQQVTKEDSVGNVEVNLHAFDDMTFINTVAALAKSSSGIGMPIVEYEKNYENVSRRNGVDRGFPSIMQYGADWVIDNVYRGILKECVPEGSQQRSKMKSLDYITHHRDEYKCLEDSAIYDKLRMIEFGFRSHKIPHLKREDLGKKSFLNEVKDGDIIMLLDNGFDKDIYLIGYVVNRADGPHLIYASEKDGKIVESQMTISDLAKFNAKYTYGFRWLRFRED